MTEKDLEPKRDADGDASAKDDAEFQRRRRGRNLAILLGLVGWVVVIYIVSIVKMSGN